jgi:uncharacterized protein YunC (DUF1805 family)
MTRGPWIGDITVKGEIPFEKAKRFFGNKDTAEEQIAQAKAEGKHSISLELHCGHTPSIAAAEVRRFLVCGVIPCIEGELKPTAPKKVKGVSKAENQRMDNLIAVITQEAQ